MKLNIEIDSQVTTYKTKQFHFNTTEEIAERLAAAAKELHTSKNEIVNRAVHAYLEAYDRIKQSNSKKGGM